MKLRNKKTGEIDNWCIDKDVIRTCSGSIVYNSLAELNEEWEDYEEPKEYWFIDYDGGIIPFSKMKETATHKMMKAIGNYFETREEAEKAVEKLKAWKRLKDKGFRFEGIKEDWTRLGNAAVPFRDGRRHLQFNKAEDNEWLHENWDDLDLLFGVEE